MLSTSSSNGAGELNPSINTISIFETHVFPEIHTGAVSDRSIVKSDAIKIVCMFRSHFPTPLLVELLPHVIRHLGSEQVVVQTYAAICIERFLTVKDRDVALGSSSRPRLEKDHLQLHFQPLFVGLFSVLDNTLLPENDHVMKCIMRVLLVLGSAVEPVTELVLQHLMKSLLRVCQNPVNPLFNHFLFESIAVLVRAMCGVAGDPKNVIIAADAEVAATKFEQLLFPPFQSILTQDIIEFVPYVFQILALLLSSRPVNSGISMSFRNLFPVIFILQLNDDVCCFIIECFSALNVATFVPESMGA